ncbi:diadenylate cyclase CdaA [Hominifimenecus sp. rT4P-3]|uniref:diadenylate cyclase CdaA n=1 Tax=Hominifimenecus sp. rT4P-3 TaxID=3242979 RepID=UPI003DA397BF
MARITGFLNKLQWLQIELTDILEILIIAFVLYHLLVWVKNTRTWFLLRGVIVIMGFFGVAAFLQLNTILYIAQKSLSVIVLAVVVVFQPELRRALEQLGKNNVLINFFSPVEDESQGFDEKTVAELVRASFALGKARTGALMVIAREIPLTEYEKTGINVDAVVTSQLLINIFEHNTPLHDGAVIIKGNRVVSATCYLPLSSNPTISKDLGTRHRAALGVSENTDSVTIVVSEESGNVSLAVGGVLRLHLTPEQLEETLDEIREKKVATVKRGWILKKGRRQNESKKVDHE